MLLIDSIWQGQHANLISLRMSTPSLREQNLIALYYKYVQAYRSTELLMLALAHTQAYTGHQTGMGMHLVATAAASWRISLRLCWQS